MTTRPAAPPPPDLSERLRTIAGKALLEAEYEPGKASLLPFILAIEAEVGAAVPLDVERLRAASQAHRSSESKAWAAKGEYHVTHMCGDGDCWDKIAAEYARLSADEEGKR